MRGVQGLGLFKRLGNFNNERLLPDSDRVVRVKVTQVGVCFDLVKLTLTKE